MGKFLDLEEYLTKHPIVDVVQRLLEVQLKQEAPNKWRGKCPFCGDPRSFTVTTDAGTHGLCGCFRCGPKGDAIGAVAKKFSLKANDAAERISREMSGNSIPGNVQSPKGTVPDLSRIAARLEYENENVQALGLAPEAAKSHGIGYDPKGGTKGRVLFPLYKDGEHDGYVGYAPDLEPTLKFPSNIVLPDNVVRLKAS